MDLLTQKSSTLHSESIPKIFKQTTLQNNQQWTPKAKTALKVMGISVTIIGGCLAYRYCGTTLSKTPLNPILEPIGTTLKMGAVGVLISLGTVAMGYFSNKCKVGLSKTQLKENKENELSPSQEKNEKILNDDEIFDFAHSIYDLINKNELEKAFTLCKSNIKDNPEIIGHLHTKVLGLKKIFDRTNLTKNKKLILSNTIKILNFIIDNQISSTPKFIRNFIPDQILNMSTDFRWKKDTESIELLNKIFVLIYKLITEQVEKFFSEDADEKIKTEAYIRIYDLLDVEMLDLGQTYSYIDYIHDSPKIAWQLAQLCLGKDCISSIINNQYNVPRQVLQKNPLFYYEKDSPVKKAIVAKAKSCLFLNKDDNVAEFAIKYIQRTFELTGLDFSENIKSLYFKLCDKDCLDQSDEGLLTISNIHQNEKAVAIDLIELARDIHQVRSQGEFKLTNEEQLRLDCV